MAEKPKRKKNLVGKTMPDDDGRVAAPLPPPEAQRQHQNENGRAAWLSIQK
jgi:hypothetical protein